MDPQAYYFEYFCYGLAKDDVEQPPVCMEYQVFPLVRRQQWCGTTFGPSPFTMHCDKNEVESKIILAVTSRRLVMHPSPCNQTHKEPF